MLMTEEVLTISSPCWQIAMCPFCHHTNKVSRCGEENSTCEHFKEVRKDKMVFELDDEPTNLGEMKHTNYRWMIQAAL